MSRKLYRATTMPDWDPVAFSPFIHDPVGQYLRMVHRGEAPAPLGRHLVTARELWDCLERDPNAWEALEGVFEEMRSDWSRELKSRSVGAVRPRGARAQSYSTTWAKGGEDPETGDKYYLRIPSTPLSGARVLSKILDVGIGLPRVWQTIIHGRSWPIYMIADATELVAEARARRALAAKVPGRPTSLWMVAYKIDQEREA